MRAKDVIEGIGILILILIVLSIAVGVLCVALSPLLKLECNGLTSDIGLPHRYLLWGGCQIQENGKWIPLDNWRYFGE